MANEIKEKDMSVEDFNVRPEDNLVEEKVLGSLIKDRYTLGSVIFDIACYLEPNDFRFSDNQNIFLAVRRLMDETGDVNQFNLAKKMLEISCPNKDFLEKIHNLPTCASTESLWEFAKLLKRKAELCEQKQQFLMTEHWLISIGKILEKSGCKK